MRGAGHVMHSEGGCYASHGGNREDDLTDAPPRPGVGCSGENVYLVGEQSGGWWSWSRGHIGGG